MKIACLLVVLSPLACLYAQTLPRAQDVPRLASVPTRAGQARGHSSRTSKNLPPPKQIPNSRRHSMSGNAVNNHQHASDKARAASQSGLAPNKIASNPRTMSVSAPHTPAFRNTPHRGLNPAVVNGSANLRAGNTAALDGSRMNRKLAPRSGD